MDAWMDGISTIFVIAPCTYLLLSAVRVLPRIFFPWSLNSPVSPWHFYHMESVPSFSTQLTDALPGTTELPEHQTLAHVFQYDSPLVCSFSVLGWLPSVLLTTLVCHRCSSMMYCLLMSKSNQGLNQQSHVHSCTIQFSSIVRLCLAQRIWPSCPGSFKNYGCLGITLENLDPTMPEAINFRFYSCERQ